MRLTLWTWIQTPWRWLFTAETCSSNIGNENVFICTEWAWFIYTGWFEMFVGVSTNCHLVLQMQPHVISLYGVTSRIRFMFLLFPQVFRNWRYESERPLKPSPITWYKLFGTNSIIVLMFVESQTAPSWPLLGRTLPLQCVRYKMQTKDQTPVNPGICTAVKGCPSVAVDTHNNCWSFQHKFAVLLQFCCLPVARNSCNRQHEFIHKEFMWLRVCFDKRSVAPLEWIH